MQDSMNWLGLMPGATGEFQPGQNQFQMPGSLQQQQQQHMQMQAMMAMAGAATAPSGGMGADAGLGTYMAGGISQPTMPLQPSGMDGNPAMVPPGVDPAMAQAYAQMYLQTAHAYASVDPSNLGVGMGVPPAPFPSQIPPTSYTPPPAPSVPVIKVSVDGMKFQYQLTEDDLQKVFSRYGPVTSIQVEEACTSAQITFQEFHHAQAAMTDLNGKVLNGLEGTLRLVWGSSTGGGSSPTLPYSMMPPFGGCALPTDACAVTGAAALVNAVASTSQPGGIDWNSFGAAGASAAWPAGVAAPSSTLATGGAPLAGDIASMLVMGGGAGVGGASPLLGADTAAAAVAGPGAGGVGIPASDVSLVAGGNAPTSANQEVKAAAATVHVKGARKHTCRFLIGIDNDKEFQVVRRIIGAKGTNMKRIVRQTEAKLRLRGVGSGYFEGAGQRESSEPLQLCVSCTSSDGYRTAVRLVEELLENVFNDYRQFCRENNRPEADLHASPQLISTSGRGGGGGGGAAESSGRAASPGDGSLSGGEGQSPGSKRDNRRRGRRSRGKKGETGNAEALERGDPPPKAPPVEEIERMIDQRNEARRQCNFTEADRLRQSLHEKGVALMDEPGARGKGAEVTTWRYWRD